ALHVHEGLITCVRHPDKALLESNNILMPVLTWFRERLSARGQLGQEEEARMSLVKPRERIVVVIDLLRLEAFLPKRPLRHSNVPRLLAATAGVEGEDIAAACP